MIVRRRGEAGSTGEILCNLCRLSEPRGDVTRLRAPRALQHMDLQEAEDSCRRCAAYSWLSYRRPDFFPDGHTAREVAMKLSTHIDTLLALRHGGRGERQRPRRRVRR